MKNIEVLIQYFLHELAVGALRQFVCIVCVFVNLVYTIVNE